MERLERLAEIRESKSLTLRELAAISGVDPNTINQLELGRRESRPSTLRKLSKALDVLPRELVSGKASRPPLWGLSSEEVNFIRHEHNWKLMLSGALDRAKRIEQQMREAEPSTRSGGKERDEIMALLAEYRVAGGALGSSELEAARARLWRVMESIDRMLVQRNHDPLSSEQWRNISRRSQFNRAEKTVQPYNDSPADHA